MAKMCSQILRDLCFMLKAGVRGGWPRLTVGSSRLRENPENPPLCCPTASIFSNQLLISEGESVGGHKSGVRWAVGGCRLCGAADEWMGRWRASALHSAWKGRVPGYTHCGGLLVSSGCMERRKEAFCLCQPGPFHWALWPKKAFLPKPWRVKVLIWALIPAEITEHNVMTDAIQGIVGRLWHDAGVCQMGSFFNE